MKKTVIILVLTFWTSGSFGQFNAIDPAYEYIPRTAITVGILQGGGSLVGFDLETLLGRNVGIQVGAGIVGFGAGLNFHFRPDIRSSFISMQYWNQGFGESHSQSLMSANYVFRARKIFTFQIGLGFPLDKGPAWPESMEQPPVMLTYAVGVYFPF
jgi:hypothetical protein